MSEKKEGEEEYSAEKLEIEVKDSKSSEELRKKQKELEERLDKAEATNADVVQVIDRVAEKEFEREKAKVASALKIDPSLIQEPSDLRAFEKLLKSKTADDKNRVPAGAGTPLTGAQTGDSIGDQSGTPIEKRTYDNLEEMMTDLENERKTGNKDAEKVLSKLTKKALKKDFEAEFQGNLPEAYSLSHQKSKDPKTQKEVEEAAKKERQKWKDVS